MSRFLWILIWAVMTLAPAIMLPFTASRSKASPAGALCAAYLCWRLIARRLPSPRHGVFALSLLLSGYLFLHAAVLTLGGTSFIVVLLEGQWVVYLLSGILLAYDISRRPGGTEFLASSFVWLCVPVCICGLISIWTGPMYEYGQHATARWGLSIDRAIGTFDSPGTLGSVIGPAFLFEYLSPARGFSLRRTLVLLLIAVTLVLTFSKGAIVATIIAAAAGAFLTATRAGARGRRRAAVAIAGVTLLAGAVMRLADSYNVDVVRLIVADAEGRSDVASDVMREYRADDFAPQLFGIGFRQSAKLPAGGAVWFTAHNSYIALLREIGVAGSAIFAGLLIGLLVWLPSRFLSWQTVLIGVLILSYTETFLYSSHLVLLIGAAVGVLCGSASVLQARTTTMPAAGAPPHWRVQGAMES